MEQINIPLDSSEWGSFIIHVPNTDVPQWFGEYQTGNLAIYSAQFKQQTEEIPGYALVYVITNQDMPELDMIGYGIYINTCSFPSAINLLYETINNRYKEKLIEVRNEYSAMLH